MMDILKKFLKSDGYSFIEIFIVIIIISLISTMLLVNSNKISTTIFESKKNLSIKHDLIKLRIVLKNECQKVTPPWFINAIPNEITKESMKIFYYRGDKDQFLEILTLDSGTTVKQGDLILFHSENIKGNFAVSNNLLSFTFEDYSFVFNFGVVIA